MATGKILREDYGLGYGRTREWPGYPDDLYDLQPVGASTNVVCANCGRPTGGLMFDAPSGTFVHRDCGPTNQSLR
jgi:hypothetical protein